MTIICAIADRGEVWIASDTVATGVEDLRRANVGSKWAVANGWAIGSAGSLRMVNILAEEIGHLTMGLDGPEMLIRRMRPMFAEHGIVACPQERHEHSLCFGHGFILVQVETGSVWEIGNDLAVLSIQPGQMGADGSGRATAIGVLFGMREAKPTVKPDVILRTALRACAAFNAGCAGAWLERL